MTDGKSELEGQIVLRAGNQSASIPSIPTPVLEALYNTVTGTKESVFTSFRARKRVTLDDIEQVCHIFQQWAAPYAPVFTNLQFVVIHVSSAETLKGTSRTRYKSLESMKKTEPGRTDTISSLQIYFSTLMRNAETQKLDNIEVVVNLEGSISQYLHSASASDPLGESYRYAKHDEDGSLTISVNYNNFVVAKGVVSIVQDWYENLPNVDVWYPRPRTAFLAKDELYEPGALINILYSAFPALVAFSIVFGIFKRIPSFDLSVPSNLVILAGSFWLVYTIVEQFIKLCSHFFGGRYSSNIIPLTLLNAGDRKRFDAHIERVAKRRSLEHFIYITLLAGLSVSVLASVVVNIM